MTTIFLFAGLESQVCYVLAMNICFLIRLRLIFFLSCFVLTNPKIQKKCLYAFDFILLGIAVIDLN